MMTLAQYEREQDNQQAREEAISDLSIDVAQVLKAGNIYQPGKSNGDFNQSKDYWHMDDFIADVEIANHYMIALINGNCESMQEDMAEKFDNFCSDIAEQCIDEVQRLEAEL